MGTVTSTKIISASVQGYVGVNSSSTSFSSLRSSTGNVTDTFVVDSNLLSSSTTNQYLSIDRGVLIFDTSVIPSNSTITSASLILPPLHLDTSLGSSTVEIVSITTASNSSLSATDYNNAGGVSFSSTAFGSINQTNPNTLSLNASGISNINIGSYSKFCMELGFDFNNSAPSWVTNTSSQAYFYSPSFGSYPSGIGQLSITYTQPTLSITGIGSTISNINTITTS